jgi:CRISPR-associated endoribonuclease Cas2 subtype I-E
VEVRASAYVGDNFARTREIIWEQALAGLDQGDAVVVWKSLTDQGYGFLTTGKKTAGSRRIETGDFLRGQAAAEAA